MIDRENVEEVACALGEVVKNHYLTHEQSPDRVLEVLNAIGMLTASLIAGLSEKNRAGLRQFLIDSVDTNIPEIHRLRGQSKTDG